jgi:hypothetical protein
MRQAIAEELRQLYRCDQHDPLPERLTQLLRKLDLRRERADRASASKTEDDATN